jgi:hypothetical protein
MIAGIRAVCAIVQAFIVFGVCLLAGGSGSVYPERDFYNDGCDDGSGNYSTANIILFSKIAVKNCPKNCFFSISKKKTTQRARGVVFFFTKKKILPVVIVSRRAAHCPAPQTDTRLADSYSD